MANVLLPSIVQWRFDQWFWVCEHLHRSFLRAMSFITRRFFIIDHDPSVHICLWLVKRIVHFLAVANAIEVNRRLLVQSLRSAVAPINSWLYSQRGLCSASSDIVDIRGLLVCHKTQRPSRPRCTTLA